METTPSTPQPFDHEGPSDHEGWNPTPDPTSEVDIPASEGSGAETDVAPGIAFEPSTTSPADRPPRRRASSAVAVARSSDVDERDEELASLRERLVYYESFDRLIRDSIDRAGELMREAAAKQGDAEVRLRTTTRDFERRRTEEQSGYRSLFAGLLDDVSALQQQAERMARQVADALDDLELQLPAAGELAAIERGQALGMSGRQPSTPEPAELPSGASSAAWVTHDDDIQAPDAPTRPAPPTPSVEGDAEADTDDSTAAGDDLDIVEDAAGEVDPHVVEDVLTEHTDADPTVADDVPESAALAEASDLPEEFGLSDPVPSGLAGRIDEPYVEQSMAQPEAADEGTGATDELSADLEGFYVEHTADAEGHERAETPLKEAAPSEVGEVDLGFDAAGETTADDPPTTLDEGPNEPKPAADPDPAADPFRPVPAAESDARAPYGDQDAAESAIGSDPDAAGGSAPPSAATASNPVTGSSGNGREHDTIVLVHGVPRATTALSLKRYLEGLASVTAVEPREYAEGILRLQVTCDRPISVADLSDWPDGSGLQEVQVREDLVEIRLLG